MVDRGHFGHSGRIKRPDCRKHRANLFSFFVGRASSPRKLKPTIRLQRTAEDRSQSGRYAQGCSQGDWGGGFRGKEKNGS